jgi:predicted porin
MPSFLRPSRVAAALCCGAGLLAMNGATQAQSTVSLYGLVDVSVGRTEEPGGTATDGVDSGKMTTSFWGVKGNEDLGGGLRALFALEGFMRSDTGSAGRFDADTFWARSSFVGLGSPWGTLTLGRNTTSLFVQTLLFNAFGDSFGFSPSIRHYFTSGTTSGDTGWSDSVKYASPSFGGLSFTLHAAANDEGPGSGRNRGASAQWFSGPMGLGLAWQKVEKGVAVPDTTTLQIAGSWDFKAVKAFAQYGRVEFDDSGDEADIWGLGASVPIGTGKLLAQYGRIDPDTAAERTTISLGYDHFLSKRTDLYGVVMSDKIDGLSSGTSYSVGLRHRF